MGFKINLRRHRSNWGEHHWDILILRSKPWTIKQRPKERIDRLVLVLCVWNQKSGRVTLPLSIDGSPRNLMVSIWDSLEASHRNTVENKIDVRTNFTAVRGYKLKGRVQSAQVLKLLKTIQRPIISISSSYNYPLNCVILFCEPRVSFLSQRIDPSLLKYCNSVVTCIA